MRTNRRSALAVLAALALSAGAAACGGDDGGSSSTSSGGGGGAKSGSSDEGGTIALLLPETKTTRYEEQDKPLFEAKVQALCPKCKIIYQNANQDAARQQQQAEAAITNGAKVLVLDAVDAKAATATVNRAKQSKIPVIAYDRLISGAPIDYYVSFDNVRVGKLQAQALLDKLGTTDGKQIVMLNGSPTDPSSGDYKKGAHEVLDPSGIKIAREYDTPDWSPDKAQQETEQAITALGKDKVAGVYSANDGMIGGAIAAMKSAGIDPKTVPTTGQDSEVAAIQRILVGEQYMTIYLAIKKQAESAAELAVDLIKGTQPPASLVNNKVNNGSGDVPTVLLDPTAVTKDNIKDTIIADGFHPASEICTGEFASACTEAGIS
ncbi:sugar ABC transporter substrate-binding protein [Solirubrobacter ginsenosidimutans]|uniref:Sugar ABC transporter substrate-binding protein n=1 Tax=Solirubrobacter ginsenosidimutans TaxID=490573 RepID=A0A9X3N0P5_9ACTN|nr:sugar ABC transporter substrate-binding protein [Solirubrobacter ginsenosidimutans]MDA0164913.1 sugar ABC transporter substrate-binding protein [Solirubrobacter ginsenosidimutans]